MVPSAVAWMPRMSPKRRFGVVSFEAAELQIHMQFGDVGADGVDGGQTGIPYEERAVRQGFAQSGGSG